jgi:hypothetical protein
MARIHEEVIIIKLSKLVKDNEDVQDGSLSSIETITALEQVAQELVGSGTIVEIEKA